MKHSILSLLILASTIFHSTAAAGISIQEDGPGIISSLVVNANVTIVLVDHPGQEIKMSGDAFFMREITIMQEDGKLVVDGNRGRNFKSRGVIYVPAKNLTQISINHAAMIRSSYTLESPRLRVLINGNCKVHITTLGKIDFVENDFYEVEYRVVEKSALDRSVRTMRQ